VVQEQLAETQAQLEQLQLSGSGTDTRVLARVPSIVVTTTVGSIVHPLFGEGCHQTEDLLPHDSYQHLHGDDDEDYHHESE
jgi:hypothetical protein